jgi:uncharacterized protein
MKLSKYNIYVPYGNGILIYNTRSYQVVYMEGQLQNTNAIFESYNGIFVDEAMDESNAMVEHLRSRFISCENYRIEIMITQRCNLACSYCYQQNPDLEQVEMDKLTINDTVSFINQLDLPSTVTFYGGEPMLLLDQIEYITQRLKNPARLSIITNGLFLTNQNVNRLLEYGITHCQVTLDGTRHTHDRRRHYPTGAGTFDVIFSNINEAVGTGLNISIRTNVSDQNKKDLQDFYLLFYKDNLHKNFSFSISDVIGDSTSRHEIIYSLLSRLLKLGYNINCPISIPCQISSGRSYTIDSKGYIYPCMYYAGVDNKYSVGNVKTGISIDSQKYYFELTPWTECLDCSYVGICAGGCRIRGANMNVKHCQKLLLSNVMAEEIKQLYIKSQDK